MNGDIPQLNEQQKFSDDKTNDTSCFQDELKAVWGKSESKCSNQWTLDKDMKTLKSVPNLELLTSDMPSDLLIHNFNDIQREIRRKAEDKVLHEMTRRERAQLKEDQDWYNEAYLRALRGTGGFFPPKPESVAKFEEAVRQEEKRIEDTIKRTIREDNYRPLLPEIIRRNQPKC